MWGTLKQESLGAGTWVRRRLQYSRQFLMQVWAILSGKWRETHFKKVFITLKYTECKKYED